MPNLDAPAKPYSVHVAELEVTSEVNLEALIRDAEGLKEPARRQAKAKLADALTPEAVCDTLADREWNYLGKGLFSTAYRFRHNSRHVLKVGRSPDCWMMAVAMANLNPLYDGVMVNVKSIKSQSSGYIAMSEYIPHVRDNVTSEVIPDWEKRSGIGWQFVSMLGEFFDTDLHSGNWGVRYDGTIALMDPVTDGRGDFDQLKGWVFDCMCYQGGFTWQRNLDANDPLDMGFRLHGETVYPPFAAEMIEAATAYIGLDLDNIL